MKGNYRVVQGKAVVARGNLRQCWMYLVNVYGKDATLLSMAYSNIYIEPDKE